MKPAVSTSQQLSGFGTDYSTQESRCPQTNRARSASPFLRLSRIIIPLAARSIILATLISAIGAMLAFDQFYQMTGGCPRGQTFTTVYWIYQSSFIRFKLGYGSAQAVILMLIITSGTALQLWLSR